MAPFPHPAHRTGQADFPHPALGQDFTLSRATPSAASEHLLELIGFPISRSFTTYCVCLELRSLPSTGVTRLPRYYEPLRHPRAPSLSLTGFRLVIADHALGLPVFRWPVQARLGRAILCRRCELRGLTKCQKTLLLCSIFIVFALAAARESYRQSIEGLRWQSSWPARERPRRQLSQSRSVGD